MRNMRFMFAMAVLALLALTSSAIGISVLAFRVLLQYGPPAFFLVGIGWMVWKLYMIGKPAPTAKHRVVKVKP